MRLSTIWALPAMALSERLRRTREWVVFHTAARLPRGVRYWAFIQVGGSLTKPNEVVTQVRFSDLVKRLER